MRKSLSRFAGPILAGLWSVVGVSPASAATVVPTVDTPWSFRATFKGLDIDPASINGNDFQVFTFDFWTVLVNLRGDGIDLDGNAFGFYEIQLSRTGAKVANPSAPVVNTFLFYSALQPAVMLTDTSVSSRPDGAGSDYLSTSVNIVFSPESSNVKFSGTISGDVDLNGDGVVDSDQIKTDKVVETLQALKDLGIITGREMGQIIKQTNQPIKQTIK